MENYEDLKTRLGMTGEPESGANPRITRGMPKTMEEAAATLSAFPQAEFIENRSWRSENCQVWVDLGGMAFVVLADDQVVLAEFDDGAAFLDFGSRMGELIEHARMMAIDDDVA
ncbi:hypothetical protein [Thioalkalivibrio sp. ALE23]|uniref:hypothetical protein n=1 Tax=Thioalkalivibrio sp. ALE23 TaxID=1265495 RepID=UPI0003737321|nr:hypothetical protein [Thioalkalivibrio sp. ALE23]